MTTLQRRRVAAGPSRVRLNSMELFHSGSGGRTLRCRHLMSPQPPWEIKRLGTGRGHRPRAGASTRLCEVPIYNWPLGSIAQHVTLHSEAIWGVMIALVFFAIFEPHDENKS